MREVTMMTEPMSKEEMIDTLKGLVFDTFDRTTPKEREALDMVIQFLEATYDCISREKAIKEFQVYREYSSNLTNNDWVDRIEGVLGYLQPVTPDLITAVMKKSVCIKKGER